MIISRTPFRVSFVGGGTDLRSFYAHEPGRVLSTSIDKYLYVILRRQIGLVESKYRINYSKVEFCRTIDEIEHPIVREAFRLYDVDFPVEVTTFADIPAYTGLGSSSAFAVGLVHAICALQGRHITKSQLSAAAAGIEVDILGRTMGKQDHYASAYGNFNVLTFNPDETVIVEPVFYRPEVRTALEKQLLLFYTGLKRDASDVLATQEKSTAAKMDVLRAMKEQVFSLRDILSSGRSLHKFGRILHEGWLLKRSITPEISCSQIDAWYEKARASGAIGGKLLGAGGGGFLLFFVEPQNQDAVIRSLGELYRVPFAFDSGGSRITYYDQTSVP
jgi:D-glycero-alpha-D-manno-heptose-7-phosphate kinase